VLVWDERGDERGAARGRHRGPGPITEPVVGEAFGDDAPLTRAAVTPDVVPQRAHLGVRVGAAGASEQREGVGLQEDECAEALTKLDRGPHRHRTTEGVPDERDRAGDAVDRGVHQRSLVGQSLWSVAGPRRGVAIAEQVDPEDAVAVPEIGDQRLPLPVPAHRAVQCSSLLASDWSLAVRPSRRTAVAAYRPSGKSRLGGEHAELPEHGEHVHVVALVDQ
jgi:hypothetical protein